MNTIKGSQPLHPYSHCPSSPNNESWLLGDINNDCLQEIINYKAGGIIYSKFLEDDIYVPPKLGSI